MLQSPVVGGEGSPECRMKHNFIDPPIHSPLWILRSALRPVDLPPVNPIATDVTSCVQVTCNTFLAKHVVPHSAANTALSLQTLQLSGHLPQSAVSSKPVGSYYSRLREHYCCKRGRDRARGLHLDTLHLPIPSLCGSNSQAQSIENTMCHEARCQNEKCGL